MAANTMTMPTIIRMVFNVLSANCDDHVKNFSFLMDRQGNWRMAPAYDLTFAYNPNNKWISEHQMKINNKASSITEDDLIACGIAIGLTKDYCRNTIGQTKNVVSDWSDYAGKAGVKKKRADEIRKGICEGNYGLV